jgi:hypothetical protein
MPPEAPDEAPSRQYAGCFARRCSAFDGAPRAPARRPTVTLRTESPGARSARPPRTHPQPRSFPQSDPADFFMKKVLDTGTRPALKGVPGHFSTENLLFSICSTDYCLSTCASILGTIPPGSRKNGRSGYPHVWINLWITSGSLWRRVLQPPSKTDGQIPTS